MPLITQMYESILSSTIFRIFINYQWWKHDKAVLIFMTHIPI